MPKRTAVFQVLGGLSESRKEDTAMLVNTCVKMLSLVQGKTAPQRKEGTALRDS